MARPVRLRAATPSRATSMMRFIVVCPPLTDRCFVYTEKEAATAMPSVAGGKASRDRGRVVPPRSGASPRQDAGNPTIRSFRSVERGIARRGFLVEPGGEREADQDDDGRVEPAERRSVHRREV